MGLGWQTITISFVAVFVAWYNRIGPFKKTSIIVQELKKDYDYIIVGGGSAGSVLAARLSEDRHTEVLLLEAGGHYTENDLFSIPVHWIDLLNTENDWSYYTVPQKNAGLGVNDNRLLWPRGRVLGGSSVLNAMQYTRGSKYDFDDWEAKGCTGWSYKDVLPYFLKAEDMQIEQLKSSRYHATGGPIAVSGGRTTQYSDLYMAAAKELGYNINDYNGESMSGYGEIQLTVRNGVRSSTGVEYLGRISDTPNLYIATRSFVTKIEILKKEAVGVHLIRDGRKIFIKANKEVIVSAGAINSPQLLMLSGIGPKEHLEELGVEVIADLPVGLNLQDHQAMYMFSRTNTSLSATQDIRESLSSKIKYYIYGTGPLSIATIEGSGFFHVNESIKDKTPPDFQFLFTNCLFDYNYLNLKDVIAEEYMAPTPNEQGFTIVIGVSHPKSRGTIKLRSADPFDHPLIDPRYLTDRSDVETYIAAIRVWEKFIDSETLKHIGATFDQSRMSFCSQYPFRSDDYWECYVRHLALTMYHPSCTCKMGSDTDPTAVLDSQLRVKGIKGLRVVDASIFPNIPSGNINAPVIMVAEKTADIIRGIDSVKDFRKSIERN